MRARRVRVGFVGAVVVTAVAVLASVRPADAAATTFTNAAPINLGDGTASRVIANPYPTEIVVSGLSGAITDIDVRLFGVNRSRPADMDALLVSPGGINLRIISDVGGGQGNSFTNADLVLTDGAPALPSNGNVGSGTYSPTNYGGSDSFAAPAPAASVATALATFNGSNPNGTWSLYILDDAGNADVGAINGGWALTITTAGTAPVAANDAYSTAEDTSLTVPAPGVLGNDSDADGDPLTAVLGTGPANGGVTLNLDGSFSYTPNPNFNGTDSFTYQASDGSNTSGLATVTINVVPVNDPPVAVDDAASTPEDTAVTIPLLDNDTDADGDALAPAIVSAPTNGAVMVNGDGTVTYTPNPNFAGTDTFTYQATDGAGVSNVATVAVTVGPVNDGPLASNDGYATAEDTALTVAASGVLGNDTDADGDPLSAVLGTGPANGTLSLASNGAFVYTPNLDFTGVDSFTYQASDGPALSNVATVTITVGSSNDPPVANAGAVTTPEDTPVDITLTGSDPDGDGLTFTVVTGPSNGALSGGGALVTYTPDANFSGPDVFTFEVCDSGVPALCDTETVTIAVTPVNDAPTAANDAYATNEDTPLTIGGAGVLTNDVDIDGDSLAAALVSGPADGTVVFNTDGSFTYTPDAGFSGTDSFTYQASDGPAVSNVATVTITVVPVNDPPVAADDTATTPEDTAVVVAVLANDSDAEGDSLTPSVIGGPANGTVTVNGDGTVTYIPDSGFEGVDTFSYRVTDGGADSNVATVTVTVTHVNQPPVAVDDERDTSSGTPVSLDVLSNDSDPDNDVLALLAHGDPDHGAVLCVGATCTYTPDAGFAGTDSFPYTVGDGAGGDDIATVRITVAAAEATAAPDPDPDPAPPPVPSAPAPVFIEAAPAPAPSPTVSPATFPLARTGTDVASLVALALGLIVGGWRLTRRARRHARLA